MEVLEPKLLLMSVEELLKEFRHMCHTVGTEDVILRALRIQLVPVKLTHSTIHATGTQRSTYLLDCNYDEDKYAETLLSLRLRYMAEAMTVMQERDADCGRWIKDRTSKRLMSPGRNASGTLQSVQSTSEDNIEVGTMQSDGDESASAEVIVLEVVTGIVDKLCRADETQVEHTSLYLSSSRYRDTLVDPDPGLHQEYFGFLTDPDLMSSTYELKQILVMCDRIAQWVQLNQKWVDCLGCMKSELAKYNMADHLLRYAITRNSHIRTVLFLLAVAGADPNSQDRWLRTPLHYAASYNRPDVVRLLLLAGADPTVRGALRSPQQGSVPATVVTPLQLVAQSSNACVTVLKGKSCVSCNVLFHNSTLHKEICGTCDVSLCSVCLESHNCVWQHGSVAGARDKCMQPVNTPNRARYHSSSMSDADADDVAELGSPPSSLTEESKLEILSGCIATSAHSDQDTKASSSLSKELPIDHHVGVLLSSLDTSLDDDTAEKEMSPPSKGGIGGATSENDDDNNSVDSGFGSVGKVDTSQLRSLDASVDGRTDAPSLHHESRRHSTTGLMSWIKSNKFTRPRTLSADVFVTDNLLPITRSPSSELRTSHKISRKKKLSLAFGSGLRKLKSISRIKNGNGHVSKTPRQGPADDIPLYWVGYRDDESYLVRLQPWQALLLPLALGAEENRSSMTLEDLRQRGSVCSSDVLVTSSDIGADGRSGHNDSSQPVKWSICEICEVRSDECRCTNKYPMKKSSAARMSTEPTSLYCRQEMAFFYALLKRDSDMLSLHTREVSLRQPADQEDTHIARPLLPEIRDDGVDSTDFDPSLSEHLTATIDNVIGIFDDTYTTSAERHALQEAMLTSAELDTSTSGGSEDGVYGSSVDRRLLQSQQTVEGIRQEIVKSFMSGFWTIGEGDEFWVSDDSVWYCRCCATQFTLFHRKHHCRRCGSVFCGDDAPHVEMADCLPESFQEVALHSEVSVLPDLYLYLHRRCESCCALIQILTKNRWWQ